MWTDPGILSIAHRRMNVEIRAEAAQILFWEYVNWMFVAVKKITPAGPLSNSKAGAGCPAGPVTQWPSASVLISCEATMWDRQNIYFRAEYIRTEQKKSARMTGYTTALLCLYSCSKKYKYICLSYSNVCAVCAHLCKPPCFVDRKCCIVFSVSRHQCQNFPNKVCCKYHRLAMMARNLQT
jgi:hypothetical protein